MKRKFLLRKFAVGPLGTNCYVVADPITKDACVIDPGAEPGLIKSYISKEGLKLKFIINTHGHGDHIAANSSFNVPVFIHRLDADFLTDPEKNLSGAFMARILSPKAGHLLEDGETVKLGELELKVMHTPGHTPGSITVLVDGTAFTGDALFAGSIGRTDFIYGDDEQLFRSIMEKLMALDDDTVICPGHGPDSTIGEEKRTNPFIR